MNNPAPRSLDDCSQAVRDEYDGLRDAETGNLCRVGQCNEYYEGYSFQYSQEQNYQVLQPKAYGQEK